MTFKEWLDFMKFLMGIVSATAIVALSLGGMAYLCCKTAKWLL